MVTPAAKREIALYAIQQYNLSQRRACRLAHIPTCSLRYKGQRTDDDTLTQRLKQLAQERPRFGYRRLHAFYSARDRR